jgi:sugar transferase (PEP-CTERM system associated)
MAVRIFNQYVPLRMLMLAGIDFVLLLLAALAGSLARYAGDIILLLNDYPYLLLQAWVFAFVMFLGLFSTGLYQARLQLRTIGYLIRIGVSLTLGTFFLAVLFYIAEPLYMGRGMLAAATGLAFFFLCGSRIIFIRAVGDDFFRRRVIVFGAGRRALELADARMRRDMGGIRILGFIEWPGGPTRVDPSKLIDVGGRRLVDVLAAHQVDELVVAVDDRRRALPMEQLLQCRLAGFRVVDILPFMDREMGKVRINLLYPSWFIFSDGFSQGSVRRAARRTFDLVASIGLLVLATPLILAGAVAIWLESRGPVLFRQLRVGLDGQAFLLLKFRSMVPNAESITGACWAEANDPRITRVGRVLRKFRIDELPQIFNVLKGEMSFVGPRPERPEFVDELGRKIPFYRERHSVKPGITGWAQLRYPYGATEEDAMEKLQYDLYYVKNQSLLFDFLILLQTAEVVLWGRGVR